MALSKKDLNRRISRTKARIAELEKLVHLDPLKRKPKIHEELEKLKKSLK